MPYPRYEDAKLGELDDRYYFAANCQACQHSARLSLVRLRAQLGDDFPLFDVRPRLKCTRCGSRAIVASFLTPTQAVGNLRELFLLPAI